MGFYLGIDGGGTKTTALVGDEKGNVILKAVSGSLNYNDVGIQGARNTLASVMEQIDNKLGCVEFESAFIGCSALEGEAPPHIIEQLCGGIIPAKAIGMNSDLYIALHSTDDKSPRCVAVCGTGSMAVGTVDNKNVLTAGGWGHIVGDGGSAYAIGRSAMAKAFELYDKGVYNRPVVSAVCEFFGVEKLPQAVDIIYSPSTGKSDIARFAPVVYDLAKEGDSTCVDIITDQCGEFISTVKALLRRMERCNTLYLYGGVFKNNPLFTECFVKVISAYYPDLAIKSLDVPAEQGALNIARCVYG